MYKVAIKIGHGKNRATSESIALPNKQRVARYARHSPFGNYKTKISVKDLGSGKIITGSKFKFFNPNRW